VIVRDTLRPNIAREDMPLNAEVQPTVREIAWHIALRDLRISFRLSTIATLRTLVQPLAVTMVFWLLYSQIVRGGFGRGPRGYSLFVLAGLLPWGYMNAVVTAAGAALSRNAGMIRRVPFPRESLVYAAIALPLLQLLFSTFIFVGVQTTTTGRPPNLVQILWFVAICALVTILALGLGFFAAAAAALGREAQSLITIAMQIWFFVTPVVYPAHAAPPWLARVNPWNVMATYVSAVRAVLLDRTTPNFFALGVSVVVTVLVYLAGRATFKKVELFLPEVL
jgi:ABC-type polysaccharide/polyol phosphate export permease